MSKHNNSTSQIRRGGTKGIPKHEARSRGDLCVDCGSIGYSYSLRPAAAGLRIACVPFRCTTNERECELKEACDGR
jgi:hypothetical protein